MMVLYFVFLFNGEIKLFSTSGHVSGYSVSLFCSLKATISNVIISIALVIHSFSVGVFKAIQLFMITFFLAIHNERKIFFIL